MRKLKLREVKSLPILHSWKLQSQSSSLSFTKSSSDVLLLATTTSSSLEQFALKLIFSIHRPPRPSECQNSKKHSCFLGFPATEKQNHTKGQRCCCCHGRSFYISLFHLLILYLHNFEQFQISPPMSITMERVISTSSRFKRFPWKNGHKSSGPQYLLFRDVPKILTRTTPL